MVSNFAPVLQCILPLKLFVCELLPVRWSHPDVPALPPGPGAVGISGQHTLSTAQVVGTVGHRNLHQPRVGGHKQQTLQMRSVSQ